MTEILQYQFFQNAIAGSLLASVLCGIVGTYIVARRLVFISGGITHSSFGGIGIGVYLGVNPVATAMAFAVASALGVQWFSNRNDVREDSAIAVFWTFGMSVGILFSFLTPGFLPDLPSFLFGSILAIGHADLLLLGTLAAAAAAVFFTFTRTIVGVAFDREFAKSRGLPVTLIEYALMALIAMTIVATLRMVGIVLAMSLLTIPQMTANLFTYNFKRMMAASIAVAMADCVAGLALSYAADVPSGAAIIFVSVITYAAAKAFQAAAAKTRRHA